MRNIFLLLICLLLSACAPGTGLKPAADILTTEMKANLSYPQLRKELAKLPGAQISDGEPLLVSYPVGTMFAESAVLPMPGGAGQLDALVVLIKQSGLAWRLKVRAASGDGEKYDAQLSAARAEVLRTYLQASGVNLRKISIMAVAESGAPLELSIIQ